MNVFGPRKSLNKLAPHLAAILPAHHKRVHCVPDWTHLFLVGLIGLTSLSNHELVFYRCKLPSKSIQDDSLAAHDFYPAASESSSDVLIVLMRLWEIIKVLEIFPCDLLAVDLRLEKLHEIHIAFDRFYEHIVDQMAAFKAILDVDQSAEQVIELSSIILIKYAVQRTFSFEVQKEWEALCLPSV